MTTKKSYYKIEARSDSEADIMIYGEIGDSWWEESLTARQFVSDLKELEKKHTRINVRINSPGGSVWDGLAIFNALQQSEADVHTWNDGLAASMAAVIMMAGNKVHSAKNSLLMFHSPSTYARGNAKELRNVLEALDKVQNSLIECLVPRSQKTKAELEAEYFDYQDHWLTADEALAAGFVDELSEKKASVPQNITNMRYQEMVAQFNQLVPEEKRKPKLISFFENFFSIINKSEEMDPKQLRDAFVMDEKATDEEILARAKELVAENASLKTAKTNAENERDTARQEKANVEQEFETLKSKPGANSATTDNPTDKLKTGGEDKPAETFVDALSECFKILKP